MGGIRNRSYPHNCGIFWMKGHKPKAVGHTTLTNGAGQGIGDSKREPVFTPHPRVQPPNRSSRRSSSLASDIPVDLGS